MKTKIKSSNDMRKKRHIRIAKKIKGTDDCPRVIVFRSNKFIYAQLIDDVNNRCLMGFSSSAKDVNTEKATKTEQSKKCGKLFAEKIVAKGYKKIVFDRNGYLYHGRVKSLADGLREGGLNF